MRLTVAAAVVLAASQAAIGQQTPQEKWKVLYAQELRIQEQAKVAFDREMEREKTRNCDNVGGTLLTVDCLAKEKELSAANYQEYTAALRSLLRTMRADGDQLLKEFDATEAVWQRYREAQRKAAHDQYGGGSGGPAAEGFCDLMLVRSHLRELASVYSLRFKN